MRETAFSIYFFLIFSRFTLCISAGCKEAEEGRKEKGVKEAADIERTPRVERGKGGEGSFTAWLPCLVRSCGEWQAGRTQPTLFAYRWSKGSKSIGSKNLGGERGEEEERSFFFHSGAIDEQFSPLTFVVEISHQKRIPHAFFHFFRGGFFILFMGNIWKEKSVINMVSFSSDKKALLSLPLAPCSEYFLFLFLQ